MDNSVVLGGEVQDGISARVVRDIEGCRRADRAMDGVRGVGVAVLGGVEAGWRK